MENQDVGSAIAIFGQQLVTTVCVTYAIESYLEETADVSAFIAFLRQLYAFVSKYANVFDHTQNMRQTAPFYFPLAFDSFGEAKASGLFAGLIGVGLLFVIACNVWGPTWRGSRL